LQTVDLIVQMKLHFGASLTIPPFTNGKSQLLQYKIELSRNLSQVRIYVYRKGHWKGKALQDLNYNVPCQFFLLKRPYEKELYVQ